jgi:hypothetical protein
LYSTSAGLVLEASGGVPVHDIIVNKHTRDRKGASTGVSGNIQQ